MAEVKSKNPYELLGNDPEEDSDREPEAPTKAIDKPIARTGKRNAPDVPPSRAAGGGGGGGGRGRGGYGGNEGAFRDPHTGRGYNREKPVDDGTREDRPRRGGGRGRGGRGATFKDNRDDKRSHGRPNEHVKQADASWGGASGGAEWEDERAAERIAQADAKDPEAQKGPDGPTDADGNAPAAPEPEPEPEDNSKSYAEYLAEQAAKKLNLGNLNLRKANEGSKENKKWAGATELKEDGEDAYVTPKEGKAGRQRQRKQKETVDIDHRFVEQSRGGDRGGRGGRGGRGEFRGRGEGRGRGGPRGGGEYRGARGGGGRGGSVNVSDTSAFPSLGS